MPAQRPTCHASALVSLEGANVCAGGTAILSGVTWSLEPGRHWAVLGPNGSGKSTFLRLVRGDIWPSGDRCSRVYQANGCKQISPVAFKRQTRLVSPDMLNAYKRRGWDLTGLETVCTGINDTPLLYGKPSMREIGRANDAMRRFGIAELCSRRLAAMSYGQALKVLICRAAAAEPLVLMLDECLEGLDARSAEEVLGFIEKAARPQTCILMSSHRANALSHILTHEIVLDKGRVAYQGRLKPGSSIAPKPLVKAAASTARQGKARTLEPKDFVYKLVEADVAIDGQRVLKGLNWRAAPGQCWVVAGPNGSGKSTLLRLLAGEHHPVDGGHVYRFGKTSRMNLQSIRRQTGFVSSELHARHDMRQTVLETVASGLLGVIGLMYQSPSPEQLEQAARVIDRLGLGRLAQRNIRTLSHGQLRRVLIARAVVHQPRALLLDEPMASLDSPSRQGVLQLMDRLVGSGVALVYATHHGRDLAQSVTHIARLQGGRLTYSGPLESLPADQRGAFIP